MDATPLESLKVKKHCEMCGAGRKGMLEPAFDPSGKPKTLCRDCRIGSAELLAARRGQPVIVVIEGGCLNHVFQIIDGRPVHLAHDLIDWDYAESDPREFWEKRTPELRAFIQKNFPEEFRSIQEGIEFQKAATK
jgi:hypothetical protein